MMLKIPNSLIKHSNLSFKKKRHIYKISQKQKKHPVFTAPNISSRKKNSLTNVSEQNYYSRMLTKLNLFKLIKRN